MSEDRKTVTVSMDLRMLVTVRVRAYMGEDGMARIESAEFAPFQNCSKRDVEEALDADNAFDYLDQLVAEKLKEAE